MMSVDNPEHCESNDTDSRTDHEKELQAIIDAWPGIAAKLGIVDDDPNELKTLASYGIVGFSTKEERDERFRVIYGEVK